MHEVHIRTREVKRVLANFDNKKSSGPDGIPAQVTGFAFCSSFRLKQVNFLHVAKLQKFGQFLKKATPRTLESILNHKLMKYLKDKFLLNDRQYGSRKNRYTGDLMALLTII